MDHVVKTADLLRGTSDDGQTQLYQGAKITMQPGDSMPTIQRAIGGLPIPVWFRSVAGPRGTIWTLHTTLGNQALQMLQDIRSVDVAEE